MAIISNFELLAKPIAPAGGPAGEVARVAVQGYFIEISNLENRDLTLIVRTRTSKRDPATDSPDTEFNANNHLFVYDITQDNNTNGTLQSAGELIVDKQLGHSIVCLVLPAGQTASLGILPNTANQLTVPGSPPPDLAIRGYSEIVQSSNIDSLFPLTFSAPTTANILVSPEHRTTFIDPQFDPTSAAVQAGLDFDQVAYSLPTSNGRALQILDTHANFDDPFNDQITSHFNFLQPVFQRDLFDIGNNLPSTLNTELKSVTLTVANVPVKVNYKIQKGKYVLEEKSTIQAIKNITKRKRGKKLPDPKEIFKELNAAFGGNKKIAEKLNKLFENI